MIKRRNERGMFMNKKNKKGLSAIVATVLIILVTVAGVAIVWAAVIPMLNNQLKTGTQCFDAESQIALLDEGYTCDNSSDGNVSLHVERGPKEFDLVGIQVLVSQGGNTESFTIDNITLMPGANEGRVYVVNPSVNGSEQVQIAPIIAVGNTESICGVTSTVVLRDC